MWIDSRAAMSPVETWQTGERMNGGRITLLKRDGVELPLRAGPIRFAVLRKGGITSNSWGVRVERTGDAYIYSRDGMNDQKVSLHASGKQHISLNTSGRTVKSLASGRFMNQWREPQHTTKAVPTLRLLFPYWGLGSTEPQRGSASRAWEKNNVLIPGHDEMVTVVSFVIVDDGQRLRKEDGSPPSVPFGVLRLGPRRKSLYVIASYEPELDLKEKATEALRTIASTTDLKLLEGEDLTVCLTGYTVENSTFILALSARYREVGLPAPTRANGLPQ